ncbi:AbrB/MazE/SpoVT family DNA-binding domain-containing protein [Domibacillus epiphyticus]|uniref:SpoVT-AbrB domain-containing protein n=1 Tax=Domibacillus epiphyticus TaxID=1714355 RepID=A0A1V2AB46_9BACI|nr:AbrB/MazE/SpoVT family DNA-binding domain-containing protein [Domibacillus epiphyticus]OMP68216.1 hypothetical protein BTO28_02835 [Domibacillus epiphyticus]
MKELLISRTVDKEGRVIIPKSIRIQLHIQVSDKVVMEKESDAIILKRYEDHPDSEERKCLMTGVVSKDNWQFSGGIVLSKEGAVWLLDEIQSKRIIVGV